MTTRTTVRAGMRLTLDEFFELPETVLPRYELHEGKLHIVAEPTLDHQHLTKLLIRNLSEQIEDTGAGYVFPPVDVVLSDNTTVAPDIVVVRAEKAGILHPLRIYGVPDIVVEALSTNRGDDLVRKRQLYAAAGVPEYWILDGDADTLTALELGDDGRYRERVVLTAADTLTRPLFPEFSLPLAQLFEHPARIRR